MRPLRYVLWGAWEGFHLSVHPDGVTPPVAYADIAPESTGEATRRAGPRLLAELAPPLPLAYAEGLKVAVRASLGDMTPSRGPGVVRRLWLRRADRTRGELVGSVRQARKSARSLLHMWFGAEPFRYARPLREIKFPPMESQFHGERGASGSWGAGAEVAIVGAGSWGAGAEVATAGADSHRHRGGGSALTSGYEELVAHALDVLTARSLMTGELERALKERGVTWSGGPWFLDELLDGLVQCGEVERVPAVTGSVCTTVWLELDQWEWQCARCGSKKIRMVPCHLCRWERCARCVSCDTLGASTACAPLYHRAEAEIGEKGEKGEVGEKGKEGEKDEKSEVGERGEKGGKGERGDVGLSRGGQAVRVRLPFALSEHQRRLSEALRAERDDALIWAACGSGKTEAVLATMADVLSAGGRVLFALPRRDVVVQLGERLSEALDGAHVVTLTGETPDRYAVAPLIVSTVHQALRFRHAFDLVVVDEVDAFPLREEPWLLAALERAKRPQGRIIMMTATPHDALRGRVAAGAIRALTLPGRPHGHPLPVPVIECHPAMKPERMTAAWSGRSAGARWPAVLSEHVQSSLEAGRRVLIFVPTVKLCEVVAEGVRGELGVRGVRCRLAAVHAGDADRQEKLRKLEQGHLDALVTTSILERGITLPHLDAVVFMADREDLFDAATLVQMAGRVGRRVEDPSGRVVFLAARKTPAMAEAIHTIVRLNELARQETIAVPGSMDERHNG